jgi:arsenite methyltransferase
MIPEKAVAERYAKAASEREEALCCPTAYNPKYLAVIPEEVVEKDYGCGDPSQYLQEGETVLDLGSGAGKICFIAAQVVGPAGRVIGVDMTDEMLEVARRNAPVVAKRIGFDNVEFRKGRIQDLALNLEFIPAELQKRPIASLADYLEFERQLNQWRTERPLIPSGSIDVVVSNCVLNLVDTQAKGQLFREIYRVLKPSGRAVIADIVSNQEVSEEMQRDAELWSGCISGAFTEKSFIEQFRLAGFPDVEVLARQSEPWKELKGIEFRSVTVCARKSVKLDLLDIPMLKRSKPKCC